LPTSEPTDDSWWSQGPTNYPWSVTRFADAIAHAEGYGIPGAIPTVANNPGDLVIPGWSPTMGSAGIAVFDSPDYGWSRLYRQIALIVRGESAHYDLDMTLAEMGRVYAGGDDNWARNVAAHLGVSTSTTLGQVLT
jgi:hypothetical protein